MNEEEKQEMISELRTFRKELKLYKRRLGSEKQASEAVKRYTDSLREKLVYKNSTLKGSITKLTQKQYYTQFGEVHEIWNAALNPSGYLPSKLTALGYGIDAVTEAIGKLESMPLAELESTRTGITQYSENGAELPVYLFERMQFHPKVVQASERLFKDGHYAQAIFESFKAVENHIKQATGLSSYGKKLMAQVFDENQPRITITEAGSFDKEVQEGFKFLFMGASLGIRNPKAHKNIVQNDPFITLEYIGFASFLLKRIGGWRLNQSQE